MGLSVYKKLGFNTERTFYRMSCDDLILHETPQGVISPVHPILDKLVEWDLKLLGYDRSELLNSLVDQYGAMSNGLLDGERISGYLLSRKGSKFLQMGPLIASIPSVAQNLIEGLLYSARPDAVVLDVNCDKIELIEWLQQMGISKQREFVRMYLGEKTEVSEELQYLIAGPEFG